MLAKLYASPARLGRESRLSNEFDQLPRRQSPMRLVYYPKGLNVVALGMFLAAQSVLAH